MNTLQKLGPLFFATTLLLSAEVSALAQTVPPVSTRPVAEQTQQKKRVTTTAQQVVVQELSTAPQVVTLLHRLSGLKMFRLLMRSGQVQTIARLDESFKINGDVYTNVIAGLALDDGETIAAWLPEVDAEIAPPLPPPAPRAEPAPPSPRSAVALPRVAGVARTSPGSGPWFEPPNVTVIAWDRRRLSARYVGLDGVTGLSVLKLARNSLPNQRSVVFANEKTIVEGQRVRLFGPEPVPEHAVTATGPVYVRMGEIEGSITKVVHAPSGNIARVEIRFPKVSAANIGSVVINDAGETLGIVDTVEGAQVTILPALMITGAAKRVLARQASVPRPWLGIRGEPIGAFATEELLRNGWETEGAKSLVSAEHYGILLTSVAPGSPASKAALKPGDVILRVNDGVVRSGEHFSWLLEEAGPGGNLLFTVARPNKTARDAVEVKLAEAPDPLFGLRLPRIPRGFESEVYAGAVANTMRTGQNLLSANGLEIVAIKPRVAARLGSSGGLLVIFVQSETPASKAGLRPGDVIEAIDGYPIISTAEAAKLVATPGASYSFTVVRGKKKMAIEVVTKDIKQ